MNETITFDQQPCTSSVNNNFLTTINTDKGIYYETINMDIFRELSHGLVSYYRGAPPQAYPKSLLLLRCQYTKCDGHCCLP